MKYWTYHTDIFRANLITIFIHLLIQSVINGFTTPPTVGNTPFTMFRSRYTFYYIILLFAFEVENVF